MAEPFLGQIMITPYNFAPRGFAMCNGQLLSIAQDTALFSLLGTTYGGNGQTTFALPDLRGRVPIHPGPQTVQGQTSGEEAVTVLEFQMPAHGHARASSLQATSTTANGNVPASQPRRGVARYTDSGTPVTFLGAATAGGGQPHNNMQPYLCLNFVIALEGVFPPRN